jgi:hypothetical protein
MSNEKIIGNNEPEYGVDSRYKTLEDKEQDGISLMKARLERIKKLSKEQILHAKLLQLKLRMENYLKDPVHGNESYFTGFLKSYIDAIYQKRSKFAADINVTPVFLSKVINNHQEPKEDFMLKLMVHSEKVFENIAEFREQTWYQIYFYEKLCDTMSNQDKWRPEIEKQVKFAELVAK